MKPLLRDDGEPTAFGCAVGCLAVILVIVLVVVATALIGNPERMLH